MPKKNLSDKEYEKLGRMLVDLQEMKPGKGYYRSAFLKGIMGGFGGVIGATIIVTLFLWILSFFDSVWFVGHIVDVVKNSLSTTK